MRRSIKIDLLPWLALCLGFIAFNAAATTYYVDINSPNPTPPYTSWSTAATNIQSAVNQTTNGDLVLVNPGIYDTGGEIGPGFELTNRVVITNAITVQSVSGPGSTIIQGYQAPETIVLDFGNSYGLSYSAVRCVCITANATLTGFTLTGGGTFPYYENTDGSGGGVWCASTNGIVISNCVITANIAAFQGGGAYQGNLENCTVMNNLVLAYGGGVANSLMTSSLIISNQAIGSTYSASGGGVYNSTVFSSAIAENFASYLGGGAYEGTLMNCTVTENTAGQYGGGMAVGTATNCIIYYNKIFSNDSTGTNWYSCTLNYCCTTPIFNGQGNITNDPVLASISHISLNSPCRGAGNPAITGGVDIDGNPWANPPSIGCSEIYSANNVGSLTVAISTPFTNEAPGFILPLQANITGPAYTSVWNFGDGTLVTNQPYTSHTWPALGTYTVTLTAYNDSYYPTGLTATLMLNVIVPSTYYVNLNNPNPTAPYLTWGAAATNIQDAVNVAGPGSLVLVTNGAPPFQTNYVGVYQFGGTNYPSLHQGNTFNRVDITNSLTVQSVNGPAFTRILGGNLIRCVYMTNGAVLSGFSISNGVANTGGLPSDQQGGGIYAVSTDCLITNCIIMRCAAYFGGGVYSGTLYNCTITNNLDSSSVGAGADMSVLYDCNLFGNSGSYGGAAANSTFNNCTLSNNYALNGGAAYSCILTNCLLVNNTAGYGGGVAGGYLFNCFLASNNVSQYGGAAYGGQASSGNLPAVVLNNCILSNNYAADGGGAGGSTCPNFTNCILNNCLVTSNSAGYYGGGAMAAQMNNCVISNNFTTYLPAVGQKGGGGVEGGLLNNCILINNSSVNGGGADTSFEISLTLNNCLLANNVATNEGGGVYNQYYPCALNQCTLLQNSAYGGGGAYGSALNNCLIISNTATASNYITGGGGGGVWACSLTNCVLTYNIATNGGGAYASTLINCTVVYNTAQLAGGIAAGTAYNCILYYNVGGDYGDTYYTSPAMGSIIRYCCTAVPTNNIGNITNAPLFVNAVAGNYQLPSSSPCINSGNNAYILAPTDLDGNPRIVGGTVDIGAYEYQTPTSVISYAYLQQYGLPTDGSVDFTDLDGSGFSVYQDWAAGLNPTNSASVLVMLTPTATNNAAGITVAWQSASGTLYNLQRSTNLPAFITIQSNITGQPGTTSYTDTSATNNVPYFYRVSVTAP